MARAAPLHATLTIVYSLVILVFFVGAGIAYTILTARSIRDYASEEASEAATTLGATLADAIVLENQGALRARGEAALAILRSMHDQVVAGASAGDDMRRRALSFLDTQRVDESGYFFVIDGSNRLLYHPYVPSGVVELPLLDAMERVRRTGSGFLRYYWRNPGELRPEDKYGYVVWLEGWDWYIVATDNAAGFLDRLPAGTLASLLNGYRQESVLAAFLRDGDGTLLGASREWDRVDALVRDTTAWEHGISFESRSVAIDRQHIVAFSPLVGFDAEVGVVFSADRLRMFTTQYVLIMVAALVAAIGGILVTSRIAARVITRPVRRMSERLHNRLGADLAPNDPHLDDLRALILGQLRALVRLDYEAKGRRAAEREVMLSESVFRNTTEGIVVTDADGTIIRVNAAFERISGYDADELLGENPRIVKSDRHEPAFFEEMWRALTSDGEWKGEVWNKRKNGDVYPQLLAIRAVRDGADGTVGSYVAVCHDISERKEAEDRLHHMATHDALTGLPNRAYLSNVLEQTVLRARRHGTVAAVLFLDIDNFKDVNDSYGHDSGDRLLQWIARRLEFQLRSEDIVVRFGGDEFVVLLPEIEDAEYASVVARRILAAVREPYLLGRHKIRPSVSIGISIYPEADRDAGDVLRDADAAMYAAKRQGRNTYRFHNPGMNENAHRRLAMQSSVAAGIDRGEFRVLYQPILSLAENRVSGAEALVRWSHDGRLASPGEFLPFLENSSMLTRLDLWVLDQVCLDINSYAVEHGDSIVISVNAGAYNLIQDDYVNRVTEIVLRNGVDPGRLAIEVTETAAIRNFERARATLRDLQAAGFKLYLDDFGEGYSSIRYLREFGVDSVKLDRGYLANVEHSESARSLVSGFTQLAHGMRLRAVVEGVETQGQLDFAREAGCDFAQGFLVGRPVELSEALGAPPDDAPEEQSSYA